MPSAEITFTDLIKHPKLMVLYAAFIGAGWLGERLIPSECEKNAASWQAAFNHAERRADSISTINFQLTGQHTDDLQVTRQQAQTIKEIDSLLKPLAAKAKQTIKIQHHGNH